MDRVADELVSALAGQGADSIAASRVCPPFVRRATRLALNRTTRNVDRGLNRWLDYPGHVARLADAYDVFHVVDHSYAQLLHRLPAGRSVVTCHDLDAFRSLFHADEEPRSVIFRGMARRILTGLQRAAVVTCDTAVVRRELVDRGIVAGHRAVVAPVGVGGWFSPDPDEQADGYAARLMAVPDGAVPLLHVGSTASRKRVDVLLRCCGALRRQSVDVHLVRVGGPFSHDQERLLSEESLAGHVSVLPTVDDRTLAAVYRRAALVLLPSEREGFGLPLVEALRSGTPVVASDLAVLREVGSGAVEFCPPGDVVAWSAVVARLLRERSDRPTRWAARRQEGTSRAARFTWTAFASQVAGIYRDVARGALPAHRVEANAHVA
jgi:glycosyltransferase involved in cell wall biosynthesis